MQTQHLGYLARGIAAHDMYPYHMRRNVSRETFQKTLLAASLQVIDSTWADSTHPRVHLSTVFCWPDCLQICAESLADRVAAPDSPFVSDSARVWIKR
jgi:hypothetical protein